jgi:uncharacterized membrane protein (UPF0127 family)
VIWFVNRSKNKTAITTRVIKRRPEPTFKKEGILSFIDEVTGDTLSSIDIEIVEDQDEIIQGLMYRSHLDPDHGMFFIFSQEQDQNFWMKNTKIQLDIIFVNADLQIVHIAKYRRPYSKDPIPSIYPSKYVVEVNGGYCDKQEIKSGDLIRYDVIY